MHKYYYIDQISGQALEFSCDKITVTPAARFTSKEIYFDTFESIMYMDNLMNENKNNKKGN